MFDLVSSRRFSVSADTTCDIYKIAGKEEALEWGAFPSGLASIAGTEYMPPASDVLYERFQELVDSLDNYTDIYDRAIHVFLFMACNQFFFDVNERMGRFMMNGVLLDAGYPAINPSVKRKLEFNTKMLDFYASGDETDMNKFMRSCVDPRVELLMSRP